MKNVKKISVLIIILIILTITTKSYAIGSIIKDSDNFLSERGCSRSYHR